MYIPKMWPNTTKYTSHLLLMKLRFLEIQVLQRLYFLLFWTLNICSSFQNKPSRQDVPVVVLGHKLLHDKFVCFCIFHYDYRTTGSVAIGLKVLTSRNFKCQLYLRSCRLGGLCATTASSLFLWLYDDGDDDDDEPFHKYKEIRNNL